MCVLDSFLFLPISLLPLLLSFQPLLRLLCCDPYNCIQSVLKYIYIWERLSFYFIFRFTFFLLLLSIYSYHSLYFGFAVDFFFSSWYLSFTHFFRRLQVEFHTNRFCVYFCLLWQAIFYFRFEFVLFVVYIRSSFFLSISYGEAYVKKHNELTCVCVCNMNRTLNKHQYTHP